MNKQSDHCKVYWIHLPEHTDIFTQGYVGITTRDISERFAEHKSCAKSGGKYVLHKALRKYMDRVIVDTILIGQVDYCLTVEKTLRSNEYTGWNSAIGGGGSISPTEESRRKLSESTKLSWQNEERRQNMSKAKKEMWKSAEHREHISTLHKIKWKNPEFAARVLANRENWKPSQKMLEAAREFAKARKPWEHPKANKSVWLNADKLFTMFADKILELKDILMETGFTATQLDKIRAHFKSGWNPELDESWLNFKLTQQTNKET